MIVRLATHDDAQAIATIHVDGWRAAYRGVVPSAFLDSMSVVDRERVWSRNLERRESETWVADEGDQLLGWISAARSRDADASTETGEIWAIYVAPVHWRRGVGRRLWNTAEEYLRASGFSEVTLWVLEDNAPAIAFYEVLGFAIERGSSKTITRGGAHLQEIRLRKVLAV